MRMQVWSQALLSGLRICVAVSCGRGQRHGLDPMLLWLCCRPADTAPIWPLAGELQYATGEAIKKSKKKKKKKKERDIFQCWHFVLIIASVIVIDLFHKYLLSTNYSLMLCCECWLQKWKWHSCFLWWSHGLYEESDILFGNRVKYDILKVLKHPKMIWSFRCHIQPYITKLFTKVANL